MREATTELASRARRGDAAALGRLVTRVADDPAAVEGIVDELPAGRGALGITGPPGAGKSTLISALLTYLRAQGKRVAVLCVDPSSPLTGGAVLGDRIRMARHGVHRDVFIRSFAARGQLGGLARGIPAVASLLAGMGYDEVIIETVGVGQNETSISLLAETSILVLSPATGDSIQAIKSGVIEMADVVAVNKSDLDGARETVFELRQGIVPDRLGWRAPVLAVGALADAGIEELWQAVGDHRAFLAAAGEHRGPRRERNAGARFRFADTEQHTLPHILRHQAERLGDAPFLSWCCQPPISYGALDEVSDRAGAGLRALGVGKGDRVALMMPNCPEFVPLWFGLAKLGAVEVPVNPDLKGRLLEHVVANSGARVVVCHASRLSHLASAGRALPGIESLVVVDGDPDTAHELGFGRVSTYEELIDRPARALDAPVRFSDPMAILYTSGTTGAAKGVVVSYEHAYVFAERTAHSLGMREGDAYFSPLPLFHIDAQVFGTYLPMIYGGRATLMERFSASRYWEQIRASGSTVTNMLGAMAHMLWKQPPTDADADHPLRVAQAIPMVAFKAEFERRFGVSLVTGYGQTETSLVAYDRPGEGRDGACGRVMPGFEVAIVDPDDRRLEAGSVGEIVLRSDHPHWITSGYHAMPEATLRTMRNLWFHTGDAGHLDDDGWLYFDGRIKDAIRRRGENVSAAELESVIDEHPDVIESAVVAVPSELTEDDIKAFVVTRPGRSLAPEQVLAHCEEHLPWFMVPRYVEITSTMLPRTPSEKIAKEQLRERGIGGAWDREAHGYQVRRPPAASERALS